MNTNKFNELIRNILAWRLKHINNIHFIGFLSIIVGLAAGLAAILLKNTVHLIRHWLQSGVQAHYEYYFYLAFPLIGILLTILIIRYVIRKPIRDGLPNVLYSISQKDAKIGKHNMYSSLLTSTVTVGFGGSVGLEGPIVATGAAIGSNLGRMFRMSYKETVLLLACAVAGAIAAIFKAPIAGIVFAIEVIMLDLTMASLVPLLLASASGAILSYFIMGQEIIYSFKLTETFQLNQLHFYLIFGVVSGFVSIYFTKMYMWVMNFFENYIKKTYLKLLVGGLMLGLLIFLMPSLYGEGFETIALSLKGDYSYLFNNSIFYSYRNNFSMVVVLLFALILLKVVATSITLGAGGVGGIFAPALYVGACTGLLFAVFLNHFGADISPSNFALVGMAGLLAGVIHAPLTGLFLIIEITGGYELLMPIMLVATISYTTIRYFQSNSLYTIQLAKRHQLLTHNKDQVVLTLMKVEKLIETDFVRIKANDTLGHLVQVISKSHRNIFPVVDNDDNLLGIVRLDDIRNIIFKPEKYTKTLVRKLMVAPDTFVTPDDLMEDVAKKIQISGRFNIPVMKDGKYLGFVSRANVFSAYRNLLKEISEY